MENIPETRVHKRAPHPPSNPSTTSSSFRRPPLVSIDTNSPPSHPPPQKSSPLKNGKPKLIARKISSLEGKKELKVMESPSLLPYSRLRHNSFYRNDPPIDGFHCPRLSTAANKKKRDDTDDDATEGSETEVRAATTGLLQQLTKASYKRPSRTSTSSGPQSFEWKKRKKESYRELNKEEEEVLSSNSFGGFLLASVAALCLLCAYFSLRSLLLLHHPLRSVASSHPSLLTQGIQHEDSSSSALLSSFQYHEAFLNSRMSSSPVTFPSEPLTSLASDLQIRSILPSKSSYVTKTRASQPAPLNGLMQKRPVRSILLAPLRLLRLPFRLVLMLFRWVIAIIDGN